MGLSWMEDESDGSLFTFLEFIDTDPVEGNAALAELMRRYEAILRRRCDQVCRQFPSLDISGDELTNQTFLKAVRHAGTYKAMGKVNATPADHVRYTSAWMFAISRNLLFDIGRNVGRQRLFEREITEPEPLSSEDIAVLLKVSNPGQFQPVDYPVIVQTFETLKEEWQIVIVWTLDKRQHSRGGRYMNRGSVPELARQLRTTDANIRQIRRRALKKIGDAVAHARKLRRG